MYIHIHIQYLRLRVWFKRYVTVSLVLKIANTKWGGGRIKTYHFAVVAAYTTWGVIFQPFPEPWISKLKPIGLLCHVLVKRDIRVWASSFPIRDILSGTACTGGVADPVQRKSATSKDSTTCWYLNVLAGSARESNVDPGARRRRALAQFYPRCSGYEVATISTLSRNTGQ